MENQGKEGREEKKGGKEKIDHPTLPPIPESSTVDNDGEANNSTNSAGW